MKVNVVKDVDGNAIAAFEKSTSGAPQAAPQLKLGQTVNEVEAPDNYRSEIDSFYKKHSK